MHPAFSVIFLTTLIGAGQGLFLALFTGQLYRSSGLITQNVPAAFLATGAMLVVVLMGLGLFASFFHLGRPERAWRSAAMWRTSWLSREVIVLPAFTAAAAIWGSLHHFGIDPILLTTHDNFSISSTLLMGIATTILAFLLFLCTGMIYASVKFIQEWASPMTIVNYTLLGGASGFTLAAVLAAWQRTELVGFYAGWAVVLTVLGLVARVISLRRNAQIKPKSSPESAIGIRHPDIRQTAQGAMGGSFNTREFFHHKPMWFVKAIKWFFLVTAFVLPVLLLLSGQATQHVMLLLAAFIAQYIGLVAERWYFFADANHPQNIYYHAT